MKAYVKINIMMHFEGEGPHDGSKFPLATQLSGAIDVADIDEGQRAIVSMNNHIASTFVNMGVKPIPTSPKPDLGAAFGGLPENKNGNGVGA